MFWQLTLKAGNEYRMNDYHPFHVSMAALKPFESDTSDSYVLVMAKCRKTIYLLCSLKKNTIMQVPLDLNFATQKTTFMISGKGIVQLTGYLISLDKVVTYPRNMDVICKKESLGLPPEKKQRKRSAYNGKEQHEHSSDTYDTTSSDDSEWIEDSEEEEKEKTVEYKLPEKSIKKKLDQPKKEKRSKKDKLDEVIKKAKTKQ